MLLYLHHASTHVPVQVFRIYAPSTHVLYKFISFNLATHESVSISSVKSDEEFKILDILYHFILISQTNFSFMVL